MSSEKANNATIQILTLVAILAGASLVAGAVYDVWKEHRDAYREANEVVLRQPAATIATALSHWTDTLRSPSTLTPDLILDGKAASIVGIDRIEPDRWLTIDLLGTPDITWAVLARSERGRYFLVNFTLRQDLPPDSAHPGWRRLEASGADVITADQAQDWLYRRGLRKEYQSEFHEAPPPEKVPG